MEDLTAFSSGSSEKGEDTGKPKGWGGWGARSESGPGGHVAQLLEFFVSLQI